MKETDFFSVSRALFLYLYVLCVFLNHQIGYSVTSGFSHPHPARTLQICAHGGGGSLVAKLRPRPRSKAKVTMAFDADARMR